MTDHSRAIVVGASADEFIHLTQCLSGWELVNAPLNEKQTGISRPLPAAQLVIVFCRKEEADTFAICEQIRQMPDGATLPLLLVIGRYEISQGTAVLNIGEASFIIKPFEEKELRDEIGGLLRSSRA